MVTVRCTQKLLFRLDHVPPRADATPTTRLGDWYANLLHRPGGQVVLFVNERSLLPLLVAAAPARTLMSRFPRAAAEMLGRLGVADTVREAEVREMAEVVVGRTRSRHVLGSMTDFAFMLGESSRDSSLVDLSLWLAQTPCSPIGMASPGETARELLRSHVSVN